MKLLGQERLELYRNYLFALQTRAEYGDKFGDTDELIRMYEEKLGMKEPYRWKYTIKIKTASGEYDYEEETLERLETILGQHQDYTEVRATQNKPKTLNKPFKPPNKPIDKRKR